MGKKSTVYNTSEKVHYKSVCILGGLIFQIDKLQLLTYLCWTFLGQTDVMCIRYYLTFSH